ncbi:TetR/AcrR family transcriptional regulator [Flexivirga caeni]|uniref:TetR family transcriptional regulator n=1 Tax=Flexivirga caeni TaxID=2294115 RepID=A0A3M9MB70_9MICO|nr:TetR/AcrR family transcriptional regulator [Flexivirga caeni]RNI22796.1 TetR family transcriptional regulator [Flexivirga caeni]
MVSSPRAANSKQLRRARIAEVATGLFLERGFEAVSIAEIAELAGVSKMTVTNHFPLKEDLVFDEFVGDLGDIRAALDPVTGLGSAIDALEDHCAARELEGPVYRALRGIDGVSTWPSFAGMILASRALTSRFHTHYLEVRDVITAALDGRIGEDQLGIAAWLSAETMHFIDWWPVEAVRDGLPVAHIAAERGGVREYAFAALRSGLVHLPDRGR